MNSIQGDDGQVLAFESNGEVSLLGAEIDGGLDLEDAKIGILNLGNAEVRGALVDLQKWPRRGAADGFSYQRDCACPWLEGRLEVGA